jgi:hypothetical protein
VLEEVFEAASAIGDAFAAQRRGCVAAGTALTADRLAGLREIIWHQLSQLPAADGAGVVAAPGVIEGKHRHLEWWQRTAGDDSAPDGDGDGDGEREFLGVAGVDIRMSHLEPGLLAILRSVAAPAVLVTAERRVVAANTAHWISGTRLGRLPAAADGTFAAVTDVGAGSGWRLAATSG